MFDQFKQDQTVGLSQAVTDGRRMAGLQAWDRPDQRLSELIDKLNAANTLADPAASLRRQAAGPVGDGRAGGRGGEAGLTLTVDADGNPRIEFLDAAGKVVLRVPE